jgi:S-adenosyl methyltransferase
MMGVMAEAEGIAGLDTSVAHPARVYDYWLGGTDNFAADREAAERVLAAAPGLRYRVRANRAFLGRATRYLAAEAAVRQFLDIGTGIPAAGNTHEVAQRVAPDARVVYVDNDPIVLLHAQALLRSTPEGATAYLQADLRDPGAILDRATSTSPRRTRSGSTTSASPPRRHCAPGSRWPGSSPASSWLTRGWCRSISGGLARVIPPRREPCPRTVPWRASPGPSPRNLAVTWSAPVPPAR